MVGCRTGHHRLAVLSCLCSVVQGCHLPQDGCPLSPSGVSGACLSMSEPILDGAQPLPIPSWGVSVDDENVTKLHTQNNVNNFDLKEPLAPLRTTHHQRLMAVGPQLSPRYNKDIACQTKTSH
jgi:hypothetical protein